MLRICNLSWLFDILEISGFFSRFQFFLFTMNYYTGIFQWQAKGEFFHV
jgi:hypothetical protein